jgi:molybdopterin-guanine dinucleotide biosynthesis protein B
LKVRGKGDKTVSAFLSVPIVAVVGSRKSGKTTTVEALVRELTKKGYRVGTIKHVHEPDFTFDARGKDTWRHAQAGARIIVGAAEEEMVTIKKGNTSRFNLNDLTGNFRDGIDVVVLEGFRGLVAQDLTVPKIVAAKTKKEIEDALRTFKPILAFSGAIARNHVRATEIPYVDVMTEPEKLLEIVDKRIGPIVQKRRESKETVSITVNGKPLPLNPYVQKVTRNVLFAIVSTLKGAQLKGHENVEIDIAN